MTRPTAQEVRFGDVFRLAINPPAPKSKAIYMFIRFEDRMTPLEDRPWVALYLSDPRAEYGPTITRNRASFRGGFWERVDDDEAR